MRFCRYLPLALLGTVAFAGCAHPKAAGDIAKSGGLYNKFVPAARTSSVGKVFMAFPEEAIATIDLDHPAFPQGAFLVARDADQKPTAVLQATRQVGLVTQGFMIISGTLARGEEIVEPGPELARLVQENIDTYLVAHPAPAPAPAASSATPEPAVPAGTAPAVTLTPVPPATTAP